MNAERSFLVLFVLLLCLNSVRSKKERGFCSICEATRPSRFVKAKAKVNYIDVAIKANR